MSIDVMADARTHTIHLHENDNVVVARSALVAGSCIQVQGREVRVPDSIPPGHKIAIANIDAGTPLLRYGEVIGRAARPIRMGEHVHTHNVAFDEQLFDYEFPAGSLPVVTPSKDAPFFSGYRREDGRTGTRNYIAVVAASNCAAHAASLIAAHYADADLPGMDGVVAFPHAYGCGHAIGPDTQQLERTISGVLDHPNVAGALLVGLGCEVNQIEAYLPAGSMETGRLCGLTIQQSGGTRATLKAGIAAVDRFIEQARALRRVECVASNIVLGLNCGGSDSFSGITANPALGVCADMFAAIGATAVLAETPEIFGAEHTLVRRARNRDVADRLLACIEGFREYLKRSGGQFTDNPSPGNKDGGLTNVVEKSLGAVAKGGSSPLMDVVEYAARINSRGLVFMNTPGYDPVSITGLAAGGVNMIAFTTGRGSAIGFPTVPVIKIATNSAIFERMRDNMDVNAGRVLDGTATLEEVGREIFEFTLAVASGRRTASERLGHREFVPWRIGPVM